MSSPSRKRKVLPAEERTQGHSKCWLTGGKENAECIGYGWSAERVGDSGLQIGHGQDHEESALFPEGEFRFS